jgi:hypothetical protein
MTLRLRVVMYDTDADTVGPGMARGSSVVELDPRLEARIIREAVAATRAYREEARGTRALALTLEQAVTLGHHVTNVLSNPESLERGCCLDSSAHPVRDLTLLGEVNRALDALVEFDEGGPRWRARPAGARRTVELPREDAERLLREATVLAEFLEQLQLALDSALEGA